MSMDEKQICLFCKWWKVSSKDPRYEPGYEPDERFSGLCRFNAPVITQWGCFSEGLSVNTSWPATFGGDFCGKFQERRDDHGDKDTGDWKSIGDIAGEFLKKRTEGTQ